MKFARATLGLLGVGIFAACGDGESPTAAECKTPAQAALAAPAAEAPAGLLPVFAAAAAEFNVPPELLSAIAYVETRWQMVVGHDEMGLPAAYGVMALRGERLEHGASLARAGIDAVRTDATANVRAAAALLARYADALDARPASLEQWAAVVERFSGIDLQAGQIAYRDAVLQQAGGSVRSSARALAAPPDDCKPQPPVRSGPPAGPDYATSLWRPSPNFNTRLNGVAGVANSGVPHMLIIHTCEGAYAGCWSWLTNQVSQVSAHYVVNEEGSEISQLVREQDRAWHIGATYDCSLNRRHACELQGVQSNHFTIGIEHAGYASQTSFPEMQIDVSARLACDITRDHDIPRDFQHIVAHGQLQPYNRTDPGRNWPWVKYVTRIQRHCGETVVDDDRGYNDATAAAVDASAGWAASDSTAGYYGAGYRWAPTSETATDDLVFRFQVSEPGTRRVEARWTEGSNRAPRATYTVTAGGAVVGTVAADQRSRGGDWQPLGSWSFPAGWNEVRLSRRGPAGAVVIADAIRIR